MITYAPVTDTDLARARCDPAFRQKLLETNLETLLVSLRRLRQKSVAAQDKYAAEQVREAVALAVKLAELIQGPSGPARRRL